SARWPRSLSRSSCNAEIEPLARLCALAIQLLQTAAERWRFACIEEPARRKDKTLRGRQADPEPWSVESGGSMTLRRFSAARKAARARPAAGPSFGFFSS